jgi:SP family arabinose:H+ symporter-like MFS transporter
MEIKEKNMRVPVTAGNIPEGDIRYVYLISIVAAVGGLMFGYDTAVIAGVIGFLQAKFQLSAAMTGWVASSAIWGCVVGSMVAGYLSDKFGRKKMLLVSAILFTISAIGCAVSTNLTEFVGARFIGGLGIGAASMLSPLYISEVAPARIRGTLVTLYQLAIVIGINLIYVINMKIAGLGDLAWNVNTGWRYMLGSSGIPAVCFFFLIFLLPESPRWLSKRGMHAAAAKILNRINGQTIGLEVLHEIKESLHEEKGTLSELFEPGLRKAMIIGIMLAIFSQITGINAIIYYAPEIFKSVGIGMESAFMQTAIIGTVLTLFTFVTIVLIDKIGRRTLLLWGVSGMVFFLMAIGSVYYFGQASGSWLLIFILGFIACFAASLGPIPWVLISEIFPNKTRGIAMSLAILTLWLSIVLITQVFPILIALMGGAFTFWLFMVNAIILLLFIWKKVPETKGKTLEEIEANWKKQ